MIVKLDAAGAGQWARALRTPAPPTPFPGSCSMSDPLVVGDDVHVCGLVSGPVDLGTGPLATGIVGTREYEATYVVRLAADTGEPRAVRGYDAATLSPGSTRWWPGPTVA